MEFKSESFKALSFSGVLHGLLLVVVTMTGKLQAVPVRLDDSIYVDLVGNTLDPELVSANPVVKHSVVRAVVKPTLQAKESAATSTSVTNSDSATEAAPSKDSSERSAMSESDSAGVLGSPGQLAETEQQKYLAEISRLLNAKKEYPAMAKKMGLQGKVVVQFRLAADGKILESEILAPSGHEILNRSARHLIQKLDGLKPIPASMKKTTWLFSVPVDYQL